MKKENLEKNNNPKKLNFKKILKKVKLRHLLVLILLLMVNTYAWFIYISKVSTGISVHVTSWNVTFKVGDETSTEILIDVEEVYPGMEDYVKEVTAINSGESSAVLSYEIREMTVFGVTYSTETYTQDDLLSMIENGFPFVIDIEINQGTIESQDGEGTYTITISWEYESGDDELDTEWGEKAYDFYEENPDEPALSISLELIARQPQT